MERARKPYPTHAIALRTGPGKAPCADDRRLALTQRAADASPTRQRLQTLQAKANAPKTTGPVLQARWIEGDDNMAWNQPIMGVQWYADRSADPVEMWYEVVDAKAMKGLDAGAVFALQGVRHPHAYWLSRSVAGFDILGGMDATVEKADTATDVIDTTGMKPTITSQFKRIYTLPDGRLLAVFKTGRDADAIHEVTMLHRIAEAGFRTAQPELKQVIFEGKRTLGIAMMRVNGVFVDMKTASAEVITYLLEQGAMGNQPPTSEFGLVRAISAFEGQQATAPKAIVRTLLEQIGALLASQTEFLINDLQFIVRNDGTIVIIDPQSAGPTTLFGKAELRFAQGLYATLEEAGTGLIRRYEPPAE